MKTKSESVQDFVPSTGDEEYLAGSLAPIVGKKDWTKGVDALSLQMLDALATDINKCIDSTQKVVAKAQLKLGSLLNEARLMIPGDKEFGEWRATKTEIKSRQTASDLMAVARKFSNAPKLLKAMNYSQLVELISADPKLVAEIEADVDKGGKPPTVKEIRTAKKESLPRPPGAGTSKKKTIYDKEPERDKEAEAIDAVQGDLIQRLNHKNPYVKIGLYPFGGPPHPYVLEAIEAYFESRHTQNLMTDTELEHIYGAIYEITKENSQ